ncbi:MAG: electron transporter RnfG [Gallionellales bacterium RBG_16_56_9]|nr:MAG: electron transporter RnfG [Gallionellales bacterium RBG_16_56_9]
MRRTTAKASLHTALNLLFFAVIGTLVLAITYSQTHDMIVKSEQAEKLKLISQIVPHTLFDNDIMKDTLSVAPDALLGTENTTTAYRARLQNQPSALVLEAIAPDGYSGKIVLLVAIRDNGEVAGARVVSHKETPGLGDYIEIAKSNWIKGFDGASQVRYKDRDWKVKKDGGQFDHMAGATITPRAVVKAVHRALQYFAVNRDRLFATNNPTPPNLPLSGEEQRKPKGVDENKK